MKLQFDRDAAKLIEGVVPDKKVFEDCVIGGVKYEYVVNPTAQRRVMVAVNSKNTTCVTIKGEGDCICGQVQYSILGTGSWLPVFFFDGKNGSYKNLLREADEHGTPIRAERNSFTSKFRQEVEAILGRPSVAEQPVAPVEDCREPVDEVQDQAGDDDGEVHRDRMMPKFVYEKLGESRKKFDEHLSSGVAESFDFTADSPGLDRRMTVIVVGKSMVEVRLLYKSSSRGFSVEESVRYHVADGKWIPTTWSDGMTGRTEDLVTAKKDDGTPSATRRHQYVYGFQKKMRNIFSSTRETTVNLTSSEAREILEVIGEDAKDLSSYRKLRSIVED